MLLFRR